ncbi:MAG: Gfo/Idh/MocA family oxidoreductase [Candidatus Nitrosocaldaceae archaeon]
MEHKFIDDLLYSQIDFNEYNIAIIGFGKMGILHAGILNLLKPNIVKFIVEKSKLIIKGGSLLIKSVKFVEDLNSLTDVNAIYITTPTNTHYPLIMDALKMGINYIFVEKPPAPTYEETLKILDLQPKIVMVGLQKRYSLPFRHAKLLLDNHVVGDIEGISAYIRSGDILTQTDRFERVKRGVLLDLGIHLVDLLCWLFGKMDINYASYKSMYSGVDDYFDAELLFNKSIIKMNATWSDSNTRIPTTYVDVKGSNGFLRVTEDYLKVELKEAHRLLSDNTKLEMYKPNYYQGFPPVNLADPEYTIEDMHFLNCLENNKEPITNLNKVTESMELIENLYKRAQND